MTTKTQRGGVSKQAGTVIRIGAASDAGAARQAAAAATKAPRQMNAKAKGNRQEQRSIALLEAAGYACTRAAASLGVFDIVGVGPTDDVLVQLKAQDFPGAVEMVRCPRFSCTFPTFRISVQAQANPRGFAGLGWTADRVEAANMTALVRRKAPSGCSAIAC